MITLLFCHYKEPVLSEVEGIEPTEESQLSKFQDIKYKIFMPYSQDNSRTVAGVKNLRNRLTSAMCLSIMAVSKPKNHLF